MKVKPKKIDIKQLKPSYFRKPTNTRRIDNICPYCLSKLQLNKLNKFECSEESLNIWAKEFKLYDNMDEFSKIEYMNTIFNKTKFIELYIKWLNNDALCEYNIYK